jgi:uncharacterized protein YbaP (TraB family)
MGRTADHVSRLALGACAALAASAALAAFPGAAHAQQSAAQVTNQPAAVAVAPIPRAKSDGPPLWVVRDADSTVYLFGTVHLLRAAHLANQDSVIDMPKARGFTVERL